MRKFRVWLVYALAWIPVAATYSFLITTQKGVPTASAVITGFWYVIPPALLGIGVWWLSGKYTWGGPRSTISFLFVQIALAILYGVLWTAFIVGGMMLGMGASQAWEIAKYFAGFQAFTGFWVYGVLASASYAIRALQRTREEESARARSDALRVRAELQALRGKLDPHFLFNTLHSVTALVRMDPALAESALLRFAGLLRYVLDVNRDAVDEVSLEDELAFTRDYLSLESLRLGDRLRLKETLDPETLQCLIPSFTLQPLVENAIRHAVSVRAEGATVEVSTSFEGGNLVIRVADDGPGGAVPTSPKGIGLGVVRQRLEAKYPGKARLEIDSVAGKGFSVSAILPSSA